MATKFTIYKITEADRLKKVVSLYADYYSQNIHEATFMRDIEFFENVVIPNGIWRKPDIKVNLVATFTLPIAERFFLVEEDKRDDHQD